MKTLIPLVGIHSSGKSTLRNQLEKIGYVTEEECAEILRVEQNLKAGAGATSSFEELVEQEEKKRDINRKWDTDIIFVESWHILTLAYLLTRGVPENEFEDYFEYVKDMEKVYSIHCIFLKSDPYKILERSRKLHSEEDIGEYYEFYKRLEKNIQYVLDKLELDYKEFNTMKPINETMSEIIDYINMIKQEKDYMEKEEILKRIGTYVKKSCEDETSGHDWSHIKRVFKTSMLINKYEEKDEFVIGMIALLHDIYDHKFFDGNVNEKLIDTLKELNVYDELSKETVDNIVYSCVNLGFSSNMSEKKELSDEGKIVQDADRLDAIGAIGIARTFAYGGKKNKPIYDENAAEEISEEEYRKEGSKTGVNHFYDKLLKVKNLMNTKKGREIAEHRTEYMLGFLDEFYLEWYGKDVGEMKEKLDNIVK